MQWTIRSIQVARSAPHAVEVHRRVQVHVHAQYHGPSNLKRPRDPTVLRKMAVLEVLGDARTSFGCVLFGEPLESLVRVQDGAQGRSI